MHNFKNDGQMEISTFPRFLIKMLNFSILDHIYMVHFNTRQHLRLENGAKFEI